MAAAILAGNNWNKPWDSNDTVHNLKVEEVRERSHEKAVIGVHASHGGVPQRTLQRLQYNITMVKIPNSLIHQAKTLSNFVRSTMLER
jgi:hypothetical protein